MCNKKIVLHQPSIKAAKSGCKNASPKENWPILLFLYISQITTLLLCVKPVKCVKQMIIAKSHGYQLTVIIKCQPGTLFTPHYN